MAKARVLVVDDEQSLSQLYVRRLGKFSYTVSQANSGQDALDIMQREEIDVLLTDYKMPGMDGVELITRAIALSPMLQCIVITGYADIKTTIKAIGAGAFNYLQKPVDFAELDIIIEKGLEKRRMLQDLENQQRQLDQYRRHLEDLVLERTLALTAANKTLTSEIEERKCLEGSLIQAKIVAENANKAKSEFLANMSHEIRTPMTSAIGLLNLVLETDLLPKQKAYLEMARISTVIMHNLLNDILDFSKIEADRLSLESIPFNPRAVVDSVVDLQHLHAEEKAIRLSCLIADDVPATVIGDPNRLRQIILNLVSNAIKFTKYGEVAIECGCATEGSSSTGRDQQDITLQFSVRDSGIGIEAEKLAVIFEVFTQADGTITRRYGGVGLGLNICSKLVAMMGGRIWVNSQAGKGSTFHFTSVFAAGPSLEKGESAGDIKPADFPASSPRPRKTLSILVVEDDEMNQWLIHEILRNQGYTVVNAPDGATALQEIENRSFDLVFLDLKLPRTNGYDVARQIRERERGDRATSGKRLPIVAMTGLATKEAEQRCIDAGMDDFLAKPFSVGQIIAKAEKHAGRSGEKRPDARETKEAAFRNIASLDCQIFDEEAALKNVSGNRDALSVLIRKFIQKALHGIRIIEGTASEETSVLFEQEMQNLKEMAMQTGAIKLSDELFCLVLDLRNKKGITPGHRGRLEADLELFTNDPRVTALIKTGENANAGDKKN